MNRMLVYIAALSAFTSISPQLPSLGDGCKAGSTRPRSSDGPHMEYVHAKRNDHKRRRHFQAERSRRFNQGRRP